MQVEARVYLVDGNGKKLNSKAVEMILSDQNHVGLNQRPARAPTEQASHTCKTF